jgi:hypothetical protein
MPRPRAPNNQIKCSYLSVFQTAPFSPTILPDHIMKRTILVILISSRSEAAVQVQKILTAWGCIIKTRLGIHDGVLENCSDSGLLILELHGTDEQKQELARKVSVLPGVASQLVDLSA